MICSCEQDGPAKLRGSPIVKGVKEDGEEESRHDNVVSEKAENIGDLSRSLRGRVGGEVSPPKAEDGFEVGLESKLVQAGRAQQREMGEAKRISDAFHVVPNPRSQRQEVSGQASRCDGNARTERDHCEKQETGEYPNRNEVAQGDQAEEKRGG